jgi:hypothetical protein
VECKIGRLLARPRTRLRNIVIGSLVVASLSSGARTAHADPQSEAKDLFARGRDLRSANDCGSAAPIFRRAYQLYPLGLGSLRNLAECEEILGHFASSRRSWLDLKRALITMPDDPKYEGWERDADEAAGRMKSKVASFVVDVYVKSPDGEALANENTGVEIFVNGESVGTTLVSAPLERDPGLYRIRAQMIDASPVEQTVHLAAGDNPHVTIRLTRVPRKILTPEDEALLAKGKQRKTMGWVTIGAGGAFLAGGLVTFLLRQTALADLKEKCPDNPATPQVEHEDGPCPIDLKDTIDRGKLMSTLSPILTGIGVLGVGAGAALILTAPAPKDQGRGLTVRTGVGRIDATWRF